MATSGEEEAVVSEREYKGGFWGADNILIVDLGADDEYVHFGKLIRYFLYDMIYFNENLLKQKLKNFIKTKQKNGGLKIPSLLLDLTGLVTSGMWKGNIFYFEFHTSNMHPNYLGA